MFLFFFFLDVKKDVWSFGVLLWEVFSMGLMPYTGLPNRVVMELVTGGGRLDSPNGCPPFIYNLMCMYFVSPSVFLLLLLKF